MLGASLSSWEIMPHTILVCTGDIHVDGVLAAVLVIAWYLRWVWTKALLSAFVQTHPIFGCDARGAVPKGRPLCLKASCGS